MMPVSAIPSVKILTPRASIEIMRALQDANPTIFNPKGVYDGKRVFYSPVAYSFGNQYEFRVQLKGEIWPVRMQKVQRTGHPLNPKILTHYVQGNQTQDENVLTLIYACNVAIRMQPIQRFPSGFRSVYPGNEIKPIGQGIELWRGYFQSVRPGIGKMFINVDISAGMFYKPGPLISLCLEILGAPPNGDPMQYLGKSMSLRAKNELLKCIRNLKVKTERRSQGCQVRPIKDISEKVADEHTFTDDTGPTTVAAWYSKNTSRPLRYPKLLSVKLSSKAYAPLEHCVVEPGQPRRKQVPYDLMLEVSRFTTMRPEHRLQSIRNGIQALQYGSSPYLRDFGISVEADPMKINGRLLTPPTLQYGKNVTIQPVNGQWNMKQKHLYKPVTVKGCVFLIYDRRFRPDAEENCKQGLFTACRDLGIIGMARDPPVLRKDPSGTGYQNHLREAAVLHKNVKGSFPSLIVVILPDFGGDDIYCRVKNAGDIVVGVTTQCLKASRCCKADNPIYWAHVCLKYTFHSPIFDVRFNIPFYRINAKLGGINVVPNAENVKVLVDPSNPTLVLGADVMHPGPGVGGRPSFASVVGSIDSTSSKYIASTRAQRPRQEMIEELEALVYYMIMMYVKHRDPAEKKEQKAPKRIVFYRNGISEGQFQECKDVEVARIKAACRRANINPKLTFIVAGKRHHIQFFPANRVDADRSGNAPAGLVVDREIASPIEFDFYLQSHGGAHYNVLFDENRFMPDNIQQLSFALCHVYARSMRSVSIVPPIYYANLVCHRARHHYDPDSYTTFAETASQRSGEAEEAQLATYQQGFLPLHPGQSQVMYFQ
ncbi:hypothetical protein FRB99_001794 [Tulasnella sp. 403]|nr:hypothetical protein FRB99_001794 [Tulasnella sp. 403]